MGIIYTFYSYKGGVGRSMALANVAALLSKRNQRVLIIDWDLEAPGLEKYFKKEPSYLRGSRAETAGVVDLIHAFAENERLDWRECLLEAHPFQSDTPVKILSAGRETPDYVPLLQSINWEYLFNERGLGAYLEELRDEWLEEFDFVLIDSRTGITDIGGVCTIHLPDVLVLLFTANEQSLGGVIDVMARAREKYKKLPYDRLPQLSGVPVPSRFEYFTENNLARVWLDIFARDLADIFKDWLPSDTTPPAVLEKLFIPNIAVWSFGENLPVVQEGTTNPRSIGFAYELLAKLLLNRLQWGKALQGEVGIPEERAPAIVNKEVDSILAALTGEEQEIARRVFSNLVLVAPAGEGSDTRRRMPLSDFRKKERAVIEQLVRARLLTLGKDEIGGGSNGGNSGRRKSSSGGGNGDDETVEIAQDTLLRHWERLKKWLDTDREFLLWRQQLHANMAIWEDNGRASGDLLSGSSLIVAQNFLAKRDEELNRSESEYIELSGKEVANAQRAYLTRWVVVLVLTVVSLAYAGYVGYNKYQQWQVAKKEAQQKQAVQQSDAATARGIKLAEDQKFADAVIAYTEAVNAKSDSAPAYLNRGIAYGNIGETEKARADFAKVLELPSDDKQIAWDARTYIEQLNNLTQPVSDSTQATAGDIKPRLYIQVLRGGTNERAKRIAGLLEEAGFIVVSTQEVVAVPQNTEVRYYKNADSEEAAKIVSLLKALGIENTQPRYLIGYEASTAVRPRHYEIWFGADTLPASDYSSSAKLANNNNSSSAKH